MITSIPINEIPLEGLDLTLREESFDLEMEGVVANARAPIDLDLHLKRTGLNVSARGCVSTRLNLICSRCLRVFSLKVKEDFQFLYQRKGEVSEGEHELLAGELDVEFLERDEIDIGELIRENILLGLPLKPLCREDCQGLCPRCGQNWNEASCDCAPEAGDPRLQVLKRLL